MLLGYRHCRLLLGPHHDKALGPVLAGGTPVEPPPPSLRLLQMDQTEAAGGGSDGVEQVIALVTRSERDIVLSEITVLAME